MISKMHKLGEAKEQLENGHWSKIKTPKIQTKLSLFSLLKQRNMHTRRTIWKFIVFEQILYDSNQNLKLQKSNLDEFQ